MPHKYMAEQLINNSLFVEIDGLLNSKKKFNVFVATDIGRWEIKHTKFLAHIFQPSNPHTLSNVFIDYFLNLLPLEKEILNDLDTGAATATAEIKLESGKQAKNGSGQIDVLLTIPSLAKKGKNHSLIIENKIDAKQHTDQLERYRVWAENKLRASSLSISYIYLTVENEIPQDAAWINVVYSRTVIPALHKTIEAKNIDPYISRILMDYIGIIEADRKCITLANDISEELISEISSHTQEDVLLCVDCRNLSEKYSKATQFILNFSKDFRKDDLQKFYDGLFSGTDFYFKGDSVTGIYYEKSDVQRLRFGFLTKVNQRHMQMLSDDSSRAWVSSGRSLVVQLVIKKPKKNYHKFKCSTNIAIGPTNLAYKEARQKIYDCIAKVLGKKTKNIKSQKQKTPTSIQIEKYSLGGKEVDSLSVKAWISDVLHRISNDPLISEINDELEMFFDENF